MEKTTPWLPLVAYPWQGHVLGACTGHSFLLQHLKRQGRGAHEQAGINWSLSYKLGLTGGQVVRLIGLLLVFASQKIVHKVRVEMAELVVPLGKEIKDSLTRQGV